MHKVLMTEMPRFAAWKLAAAQWELDEQDALEAAAFGGSSSIGIGGGGGGGVIAATMTVKTEGDGAGGTGGGGDGGGGGGGQSGRKQLEQDEKDGRKLVRQKLEQSGRLYGYLKDAISEELRLQCPTPEDYAHGLWRWLKGKFESTEPDSVGQLFRQWANLHQEADESFDAWRARVNRLRARLIAAKETPSAAQYAFVLLDELQPRYTQVVLALKTGGKLKDSSTVDWDEVAAMVNAFERQQAGSGAAGAAEERTMAAMYGRSGGDGGGSGGGRGGGRGGSRGGRGGRGGRRDVSTVRCYNCQKLGHYARTCGQPRKNGGGQEGGAGREGEGAAAAMEHDTEEEPPYPIWLSDNAFSTLSADALSTFVYDEVEPQRAMMAGMQLSARNSNTYAAAAARTNNKSAASTPAQSAASRPAQASGAALKPAQSTASAPVQTSGSTQDRDRSAQLARPGGPPRPLVQAQKPPASGAASPLSNEEARAKPLLKNLKRPNEPGNTTGVVKMKPPMTATQLSAAVQSKMSSADRSAALQAAAQKGSEPRRLAPAPVERRMTLAASLADTRFGLDTMASCHVTGNAALIRHLVPCARISVDVANGDKVHCEEKGRVTLRLLDRNTLSTFTVVIDDVYYSKEFPVNLLSMGKLTQLNWGMSILSKEDAFLTLPKGQHVTLTLDGRVFTLKQHFGERVYAATTAASGISTADGIVLLHARLGHAPLSRLLQIAKAGHTEGVAHIEATPAVLQEAQQRIAACVACAAGHGKASAIGHDGLDKGPDVLHMDSFEATGVRGRNTAEYGLAVSAPYTKALRFCFALSKSELKEHAVASIAWYEKQSGSKVKRVVSDNGSEFDNKLFADHCSQNGIVWHRVPVDTPQLNGVAERAVGMIKDGGRTLLLHAGLPPKYWRYAVTHYVYVYNRVTVSPHTGRTSVEEFTKKRASLRHVAVFGCDVWLWRAKEQRSGAFDAKGEPGVYLGHNEEMACSVVLRIKGQQVVRSKNVRFSNSFAHVEAMKQGEAAVQRINASSHAPLCADDDLAQSDDDVQDAQSGPPADAPGGLTVPAQGGLVHQHAAAQQEQEHKAAPPSGYEQDEAERASDEHVVESIRGKRATRGGDKYLVHWEGYGSDYDSWEPVEQLGNAREAIDAYERREHAQPQEEIVRMCLYAAMVDDMAGRDSIGLDKGKQALSERDPERAVHEHMVAAVTNAAREERPALQTSSEEHIEPEPEDTDAPATFREAMRSSERKQWRAAMDKEMASCEEAQTWLRRRRSGLPRGANVIRCKWVFKKKTDEHGRVIQFKARLTPKGYMQKYGKDYFEVFARTGMYKTMRIGLALAALMDLELYQLDVPSAFLNAGLPKEYELFMDLPEGYDDDSDHWVLQLLKALYGTKQGPRLWYLLCSGFIISMGFTACVSDPCLFFRLSRNGRLLFIFLFVDDFQAGVHITDSAEWAEYKAQLVARFNIKDLGESVWILGMRIRRDRQARTITLDQQLYVTKALSKFGMQQCKPAATPAVAPSDAETASDAASGGAAEQSAAALKDLYMEIVGTLLYAAISTRPDIAYAVQMLTRHMQAPQQCHMVAARRVLRYLAGTKEKGLLFGGSGGAQRAGAGVSAAPIAVSAFADADWANDKVDRKSITGWVVKVNGDVVSWASKKQRTVAQSTCEAELYATSAAVNEVTWTVGLLQELCVAVQRPSAVFGDNQSTITVSTNGVKTERTKHVDVKYHVVTQEVEEGRIALHWVQSSEQQADIFTKALARPQFELLRDTLMTGAPAEAEGAQARLVGVELNPGPKKLANTSMYSAKAERQRQLEQRRLRSLHHANRCSQHVKYTRSEKRRENARIRATGQRLCKTTEDCECCATVLGDNGTVSHLHVECGCYAEQSRRYRGWCFACFQAAKREKALQAVLEVAPESGDVWTDTHKDAFLHLLRSPPLESQHQGRNE